MADCNVRFAYENLLYKIGIDISATSEETTLPAENVAHPFPSLVWRTTQATGATITIDLQQSYTLDTIAIFGHNLTENASIVWQSATMASFATLLTAATIIWREGIIHHFPASHNAQFHRFRFEDPTNPDDYMEVGGIFIGEYFEPDTNFHVEYMTGKRDLSITTEAEEGHFYSDEKNQRRAINLNWKSPISIDSDDRDGFESLFDYAGTKRDFLVFLDAVNVPEWVYYGRLRKDIDFQNVSSHDWYEISIDFEEAL